MARLSPGFLIEEDIYTGSRFRACRGRRESDGAPVVLRMTVVDGAGEGDGDRAEAHALDGLMDTMLEVSGARRGFLFLAR